MLSLYLMRTSTPPNNEAGIISTICAPTLPAVDWRPIRGSLEAFRSGYEEIEQLVSQLLDEIDSAWQQLDAERSRADGSRALVPIEAQAGAVLLQPLSHPLSQSDSRDGNALEQRIAELQEDRFALQAEIEFTRNQLAEQTRQLAEERRRAADERATWTSELRLLREAIHQQMAAFRAAPPEPAATVARVADSHQSVECHQPTDPVLGPLLTQFKILQRDAARRRETAESKPE